MQRIRLVWIVAVAALGFFVGTGRSMAQDQARKAPTAESHVEHLFSLSTANTYDHRFGLDPSRLLSFQSDGAENRGDADDVAKRQSVDAFTSLEDGQPGEPGEWELEFNLGSITTSDESDPITLETELQYTFDGGDFLRNMQLSLEVPVVMGNGDVDGNADVEMKWQQRWVVEHDLVPTLATLVEVRVPTGFQSEGVDVGVTGIVAKDWGPGTIYLNALIESANGDNVEDVRDLQWAFRTGYKWRFDERTAFIFDYVHRSSEEHGDSNSDLIELAGEFHVDDHLTIGPGIMIGIDDKDETPNFGAGVRVVYGF